MPSAGLPRTRRHTCPSWAKEERRRAVLDGVPHGPEVARQRPPAAEGAMSFGGLSFAAPGPQRGLPGKRAVRCSRQPPDLGGPMGGVGQGGCWSGLLGGWRETGRGLWQGCRGAHPGPPARLPRGSGLHAPAPSSRRQQRTRRQHITSTAPRGVHGSAKKNCLNSYHCSSPIITHSYRFVVRSLAKRVRVIIRGRNLRVTISFIQFIQFIQFIKFIQIRCITLTC